jgi:hypothetical protein
MAVTISGDTGISPVTASGTSASVDGMTVGRGGGEVSTNTAVGASALVANTTGSLNTAIGYQALDANTTGLTNTAVGENALGANTTSNDNTAVGRLAAALNTTGTSLSVLGSGALYANTTGSYNTAIGKDALVSNTTASYNTAVGYQAGYSNTTGANGTFIGIQSGYSVTTGTQNQFFGQASGYYVTTGAKNTILGSYSGNQGGLDIRTASNYIVLSDGDGNPKGYFGSSAYGEFTLNSSASQAYNGILNFAEAGTNKVQQYYQKNVTSFYVTNNSSGGVYLGSGATAWASASDERLKDIIEPIENGLTKVASLRAVIGKFKTDAEGTRRSFLIAQDVQAVLPEAISTTMVKDDETNTEYLGVSYTDVIPLLVAAIKELKAEFDAYKATHP